MSGPVQDEDIASATRLCKMFNDHRHSMSEHVASEILRRLKKGLFHHNSESVSKPSRHRIVAAMRDDKFDGPVWHNATYDNWFLVAGVYEGRLKNAPLSYIARVVSSRYGWDLSKDLRYKNGPAEQSPMVTQMAAKESLPLKVRRTSAGPSNEEEEVSQAFDMSFLKHRAAKTQWG
ncbi:hypothetical protein CEP52_015589 [Fusarium oligoseptatum]|uniref:Uncharacterized protein n=1 Tax=Fusarium oligoseptatum TaxID=2604345 RepID=A0A428SBX3_9HYPO|nr:hypothetical protein CEP52_015589 [Fusarium oligoseptatum]